MFSGILMFAALAVHNLLLSGIALIIAVLFVRDAIRLQKESVEITETGMKIYKKDRVAKELLWRDMTYIVVKGKKWLVMSNGREKFTLTNQLENLHKAAKEIIDYNRQNKNLFVDPTMNTIFHVGVKLNSDNHIIK